MELLYVLDFGDCTVNCLHLRKEDEQFENTEDLLQHWGFNPDNCSFMYTTDEADVEHYYKPLND